MRYPLNRRADGYQAQRPWWWIAATLSALAGCATTDRNLDPKPPWPAPTPRQYVVHRAHEPIVIDGRPDGNSWKRVRALDPFVDIEGPDRPGPRYRTEARLLWDNEHLYVAAWLEEPHVWAEMTARDAVIWHENDFEVFIDPDDDGLNYYEFEINARNTVFDLILDKAYSLGGKADHDWNAKGLRSAVCVDGTLNDPRDVDRSWSVELAIPWIALAEYSTVPVPPRAGDTWRMNFSRVQWDREVFEGMYRKIEGRREYNWVWSPQGAIDMHLPERWGFVTFAE